MFRTHQLTGAVRPHKYVMRVMTPSGGYQYIYVEDLLKKRTEDPETKAGVVKSLITRTFIKFLGKKRGEQLAVRYLEGLSLSSEDYKLAKKIVGMLRKVVPEAYESRFEDVVQEANHKYEKKSDSRDGDNIPEELRDPEISERFAGKNYKEVE